MIFRTLQEQSDRSVSEAQNKIRQLENELLEAKSKLGSVNNFREEQGQEVINLKQDINTLKKNLAQLEKEKDDLLVSELIIMCIIIVCIYMFLLRLLWMVKLRGSQNWSKMFDRKMDTLLNWRVMLRISSSKLGECNFVILFV